MNQFRIKFYLSLILGISLLSCKQQQEEKPQETTDTTQNIYEAHIMALNAGANKNRTVTGDVQIEILGGVIHIDVEATGLEPNMMHLQHLHGSPKGGENTCPDAQADKNADGIVDVTEAAASAGITMIPFHDDPASLKIKSDTYPKSDENGFLTYRKTVSLDSLNQALKKEFGIEEFDPTKFTYMIHGVPQDVQIPETAGSVMELPVHITLPVGCAKPYPKNEEM